MDGNLLQKRILLLPQVIQNLIGEYNVEHRKLTQHLHEEYFRIIYKNCRICNSPFQKDLFCCVDYFINKYFINKTYGLNWYWCSENCLNEDKNFYIKQKYIELVNDYICNKTLLLERIPIEL